MIWFQSWQIFQKLFLVIEIFIYLGMWKYYIIIIIINLRDMEI